MSNNTPRNLVISDKTTYTIRLFIAGHDSPVAIYKGVEEYHTRPDCGTVTFRRASGQREETDMYFEAIQE